MNLRAGRWIGALLFSFSVSMAWAANFDLVRSDQIESIDHDYWQAQVGEGTFDRVGLHRYAMQGQTNANTVLLYLPGTHMNSAPNGLDQRHNLFLTLASVGIVIYGLDYRTASVPADYRGDTDFMWRWTKAEFVADAGQAFDFIQRRHKGASLFIAGFSRGATYAYALAGMTDIAGLVILDGMFKSYVPGEYDQEAARSRLLKQGRYADILSFRRGWDNRQAMLARVIADPSGPAQSTDYKTIGEQFSRSLDGAFGPGALANPGAGASDVKVLARLMQGYDRFFPAVQGIEGRALASVRDLSESGLDDAFGDLSIPLIYFGASKMGAAYVLNGIYSAVESGAGPIELHVLEGYGHLDVLVGKRANEDVFQPLVKWLGEHGHGS